MVIRMRHTRAHTKNRRSHHGLKEPVLSKCSNCGESHRPHHMCLECGFYNGKQVMDLESLKTKRDARIQSKKERIKAEGYVPEPETTEVAEEIPTTDTSKEATEENTSDKKPEKKPE